MDNLYSCMKNFLPPNSQQSDRVSWLAIYSKFAELLSRRSTCSRAKVGCIITSWDHNRILAIGYNGNYKKGPNCCDSDEAGNCGCLHAEDNAIVKLDYNDPAKKRLYTTNAPCLMCAKRIINAGIIEVVYKTPYRLREGLDLLTNNGIQVINYNKDILLNETED